MNRIILKQLILRNFKGIRELEVDFKDVTDIKGDNGTGKTTIYDGFSWLFFDKDSMDRKNFEIKTLDLDNNPLHEQENEVIGILEIDGAPVVLRKIYREKWTRVKGEIESKLEGHETLYYVNEVLVKQSEYKDFINKFINELQFKLISNPRYFSSDMKWEDRRKLIIEIAGDIPDKEVIDSRSELIELKPLILKSDINAVKKSVADKKKRLNDELKTIPMIISELNSLLHVDDYSQLEADIKQQQLYIKELDEDYLNLIGQIDKYVEEINRLVWLRSRLSEIESKTRLEIVNEGAKLEKIISKAENDITEFTTSMDKLLAEREETKIKDSELKALRDSLNEKWGNFLDREYIKDFDSDKSADLLQINKEAVELKEKLEISNRRIEELNENIKALAAKKSVAEEELTEAKDVFNILDFDERLKEDSEYKVLNEQVADIEKARINLEDYPEKLESIKSRRSELMESLGKLKEKQYEKEADSRILKRIGELKLQIEEYKKELAEEEKKEVLCDKFLKIKIELLEPAILKKFDGIKFKLFNTLVKGTVEDCCEVLIDGVPYSNANKAAQIAVGLKIINLLCAHYSVQAPVFIDNRESINQIPECCSQIINLIVSRDQELKVE